MIVRLEEEGWKIEAAIQKVSDIAKLDHTTVRDIWSAWAERARSALRNFRRTQLLPANFGKLYEWLCKALVESF